LARERAASLPYHPAVIVPRPFLVAFALAAAMVAVGLVYGVHHGAPAAVAAPAAPAVRTAETAVAPASMPDVTITAASPAPLPAPSTPGTDESLAQKVDRLSRSASPVDAFAAYQLVTNCIWARDHEGWMAHHILPSDRGLLPTAQQACGDIASDQIQSRLRWLERAALAGVHHAAAEMVKEGPDGLGLSGSSDIDAPENAYWKQRVEAALDAGVHTCDAESLENRVNSYESGIGTERDRAKALTYWVAYMQCRQHLAGTPGLTLASGEGVTRRMGASLSADQIAAAIAAGQRLAQDARPLPGDTR
jgi:hypothetical protein